MTSSSWRRGSFTRKVLTWAPHHIRSASNVDFLHSISPCQSATLAGSCSGSRTIHRLNHEPATSYSTTSISHVDSPILNRPAANKSPAISPPVLPPPLPSQQNVGLTQDSHPRSRNNPAPFAAVTQSNNRKHAASSGGRSGGSISKGNGRLSHQLSGASDARPPISSSISPAVPATSSPSPLPSPTDHSCVGYTLVSTPAELELMLDQLAAAAIAGRAGSGGSSGGGSGPSGGKGGGSSGILLGDGIGGLGPLAIDCEGFELGRLGGKLCLLQLSARCGRNGGRSGGGGGAVSIWLVDVATLGRSAFKIQSRLDGVTNLKGLLEDAAVIKYLYDVRRDAEALSSEYGVRLRGVIDLQLADVAMRQAEGGLRSGGWVEGLVSTLSRTLAADGRSSAPPCLAADLAAATAISRRYHKTNNTQVWSQRPLTLELCEYAATDVRYLHSLAGALTRKLSRELAERVVQESYRRMNTTISNDKDTRAAAPVMVVRHDPSSSPGTADRPSGGGSGGGGRGSRGSAPYVCLVEWLTVALLLRYDRYGLEAAAPPQLPASAGKVTVVDSQQCIGQKTFGGLRLLQQTPWPPAQPQKQQAALLMSPLRHHVHHRGESRNPGMTAPAAAVVVAAAVVPLPSAPAATIASLPANAILVMTQEEDITAVWEAAPTTGGVAIAANGSHSSLTTTAAETVQAAESWRLAPEDVMAACLATAVAAAGADVAAMKLAEVAEADLYVKEDADVGPPQGTASARNAVLLLTIADADASPAAAATAALAAGASLEGTEAQQLNLSGPMSASFLAPLAVSVQEPPPPALWSENGGSSVQRTSEYVQAQGGTAEEAPLAGIVSAHDGGTETSTSSARLLPPPPLPPLILPSLDTIMWAEQTLSDLWLKLSSKYEFVDVDEEAKLARLAVRWLLASQMGLMGRAGAGRMGTGLQVAWGASRSSGIAGRQDPGLRWLLE